MNDDLCEACGRGPAGCCCDQPATGADLLNAVRDTLARYVILPTPETVTAVVLWVAATHGVDHFEHATRLVVNSPEKRCGKTRLLEVLIELVHRPLPTASATAAAIYRSIGDAPPTLFVDEADGVFGKNTEKSEKAEDLRCILNAGFQRGWPVLRCTGPLQIPTEFPVYAMAAIAGIGTMPDTVTDRAVNVTMQRRKPGQRVAPFRARNKTALRGLREQMVEWVGSLGPQLKDYEPDMPVEDRAADTWEPLVAIADLAGGQWPNLARAACRKLVDDAEAHADESSLGIRLLADCRTVFTPRQALGRTAVSSEELVTELRAIDEAPWESFGLDQRGLARKLAPYGIAPKQVRPLGGGQAEKQVRGYRFEDFHEAFTAYLPVTERDSAPERDPNPSVTPSTNVTPSQAQVRGPFSCDGQNPVTDAGVTPNGNRDGVTDTSVTPNLSVTPENPLASRCDGVTDRDAPTEAWGLEDPEADAFDTDSDQLFCIPTTLRTHPDGDPT